ncbi:UNVERIFIED_CONTAM: hypothetical protein KB573_02200 [Streptococcus canis]|uniref:Integrase n=1 Tax=Streptococcus canis FSL Z3-227 TaxID=482234 RepID=A0AAV3FRK9_STRCB|nr:hypothetical protein [Streptococcus canis]EIQ81793.1 putative integrase [Streptococcus canis FSL Z3-227]MDV5987972.1 hypothetical protein [Streptococcus canis]MDV6001697.1 hypothetical protein [Streptococcus canis]MDV6021778.1 hypothetical protein [Streptococcus canis]VEE25565.1 degenerate transposase [Streptococcus canis]
MLSDDEKTFIQDYLTQDWNLVVIKGTSPDCISYSMKTLYRLVERGVFKPEEMPWKGHRKLNGYSEKRRKQTFRRDLHEQAESYPEFKTEFGHLKGGDYCRKGAENGCHHFGGTLVQNHYHASNQWT